MEMDISYLCRFWNNPGSLQHFWNFKFYFLTWFSGRSNFLTFPKKNYGQCFKPDIRHFHETVLSLKAHCPTAYFKQLFIFSLLQIKFFKILQISTYFSELFPISINCFSTLQRDTELKELFQNSTFNCNIWIK